MIGIAWVLDRAAQVPDLFVDAAEVKSQDTVLKPGKA
jgi:hypothetical protein